MRIETTNIDGLLVIEGLNFSDDRGKLLKPFSESFLKDSPQVINTSFKEVWFTKSHKNVIRAMHLQTGVHACEKIVSVIHGEVLDVILDVRESSRTFGQYLSFELNEFNSRSLYIPKGCAHGYKVLKDNTITMYMATDIHDSQNDIGIRWDSFGFNWDIENPIISDRDDKLPVFK